MTSVDTGSGQKSWTPTPVDNTHTKAEHVARLALGHPEGTFGGTLFRYMARLRGGIYKTFSALQGNTGSNTPENTATDFQSTEKGTNESGDKKQDEKEGTQKKDAAKSGDKPKYEKKDDSEKTEKEKK